MNRSVTVKEFKEMISKIDSRFDDMEIKVLIDDNYIREDLINSRIGEERYDRYLNKTTNDVPNETIETILNDIDNSLKFRISKWYSLEYRVSGLFNDKTESDEFLLVVGDEVNNKED